MEVIHTIFKYAKELIPLRLNRVQYITLHHTESTDTDPEEIHRWHLANGWSGFGYNEYIRKDGRVYIGRGDFIGAHTKNNNSISYGIAVEGNYDTEVVMPKQQFNSLVERVKFHQARFPKAIVSPHKELTPTSCPGKYFPIRELLTSTVHHDEVQEHWADKVYNELTKDFGLTIHEKRFDDSVTRGESMALLLQLGKSLKFYIDNTIR